MPGVEIRRSRRSHAGAEREAEYLVDQPVVADSEEGTGGEQGFGVSLRRFITAGLYNSDFGQACEDLTLPIDDQNNPLPYWSFVRVAGEAVTAQLIADASSASGYVLRFAMGPGVAGDEAYIEQIVPINGSRGQTFYNRARIAVLTAGAVNNMLVTQTIDWLKADGVTATGPSTTTSRTTAAIGAGAVSDEPNPLQGPILAPPGDAYYMRVRFGFKRGAEAVGSSGQVDFCEARVSVGATDFYIAEGAQPGTFGPGQIRANLGQVIIQANLQAPSGSSPTITLNGGAAGAGSYIDLTPDVGGYVSLQRGVHNWGFFNLRGDETLTLTGAQNDVAMASTTAVLRWNGASGSTWTGLTGGVDGRVVVLKNVTAAQTLLLSHDVTSTAANRFFCPNAGTFILGPNESVVLVYDEISVRWRVISTKMFRGARAFNSAVQSINSGAETAVTFNSEDYDTDAIHDNAANTSRMTVPAGFAGKWRFKGTVTFPSNVTGTRYVRLKKGGATYIDGTLQQTFAVINNDAYMHTEATLLLAAADYIELIAFQNSGGAMNIGSATVGVRNVLEATFLGS